MVWPPSEDGRPYEFTRKVIVRRNPDDSLERVENFHGYHGSRVDVGGDVELTVFDPGRSESPSPTKQIIRFDRSKLSAYLLERASVAVGGGEGVLYLSDTLADYALSIPKLPPNFG